MQPARFEYDVIRRLFTDASLPSRWLTREGAIGEAGSAFRLWRLPAERAALIERRMAAAIDRLIAVLEPAG